MTEKHYSILELIACAEREVQMRKQVYPMRVQQKKMSRATAEGEIAKMKAIVGLLRKEAGVKDWAV
jgi:hypothetical protein